MARWVVCVSVGEGENPRPGLPRKFYELSKKGRRVLVEETQRMQALVLLAEQRLGEVVG